MVKRDMEISVFPKHFNISCSTLNYILHTCSESRLVRGLNIVCFTKPASTTYTIPSMVSEVEAMSVAITTCREHEAMHAQK